VFIKLLTFLKTVRHPADEICVRLPGIPAGFLRRHSFQAAPAADNLSAQRIQPSIEIRKIG
jgi:hypothetical protein